MKKIQIEGWATWCGEIKPRTFTLREWCEDDRLMSVFDAVVGMCPTRTAVRWIEETPRIWERLIDMQTPHTVFLAGGTAHFKVSPIVEAGK